MRCVVRHRRVVACLLAVCFVLVGLSPVYAQSKGKAPDTTKGKAPEAGKGKAADSGKERASEPAGSPRQADAITVNARSAVLMEAASGQILASHNKDEHIPPASFVKVLTLYVVYDMLREGKLKLTDEIYISKKAWETGGSKMYIAVGTKVPLEEIIKGIAVVSGNDACVAVAEHVAGTTEAFVKLMNDTASKLGMRDSHFENPHGLPSPQQYTTAYDMALLSQAYVNAFPDALKIHSLWEYTYSNIRQDNRNLLLRKDPTVDGLKTGYIEESGYHLVATAKRDERRLIAVVMGTKNRSIRAEEALKMLNYGYRNFAFVSLFSKGQVLYELPVWKGQRNTVRIIPAEDGMFVVPAEQKNKLDPEQSLPEEFFAPIAQGQELGRYVVKMGANVLRSIPLIAESEVPKAGLVKALLHSLLHFLQRVKILTYVLSGLLFIVLVILGLNFFARSRRPRSRVRL
ncbi:MAG: D-alanyl-D-alanine carboxypeptidase family protein [Candidatus Tectimicrobiota bacterium]